ncbi:MAG: sensor histidine kinase [Acidimicrobiales bacterium]
MTERFAEDSGVRVGFRVTGRQVRLGAEVESSLYRVAHEALANAWRHARCRVIDVDLVVGSADVTLRVRDDGVGFSEAAIKSTKRTGVQSMRRAMEKIGGTPLFGNGEPTGAVVEAKVGRERR